MAFAEVAVRILVFETVACERLSDVVRSQRRFHPRRHAPATWQRLAAPATGDIYLATYPLCQPDSYCPVEDNCKILPDPLSDCRNEACGGRGNSGQAFDKRCGTSRIMSAWTGT